MKRPGGGLASGSCVLHPTFRVPCSKPAGPWRVLPESLSHARVLFSRITSPMEHSPPCVRAIFKAQIRSDLHILKLSCSFPAALRMKSSILGWPHEALLHSAPATTSSAPCSSRCSLRMEDLLPAQTCPPQRHPPCPTAQNSHSHSPSCLPGPVFLPNSYLSLNRSRLCFSPPRSFLSLLWTGF